MGCGGSKRATVVSHSNNTAQHQEQTSVHDNNNNKVNNVTEPLLPSDVKKKTPVKNESYDPIHTTAPPRILKAVSVKTINGSRASLKQKKYEPIDASDFTRISYEEAARQKADTVDEMWAIVKATSDKSSIKVEPTKNRKGWRTIRVFVSSTFKDFHQEREVLVKEVRENILFFFNFDYVCVLLFYYYTS